MDAKFDQLKSLLRGCGRALVAYSGGVDSTFLAKVAADVLGERMLAVIADTPSLPRREFTQALALAEQLHIPVRVIKTDEMADVRYTSNPAERCYFCKGELLGKLVAVARAEGWQTIVYGENASDSEDFAPARRRQRNAARAPLREVGLTKAEIRALSRELGLSTADKPQIACLSSRIPYGEPVTVVPRHTVGVRVEELERKMGVRPVFMIQLQNPLAKKMFAETRFFLPVFPGFCYSSRA